jgi:hypothetical protein
MWVSTPGPKRSIGSPKRRFAMRIGKIVREVEAVLEPRIVEAPVEAPETAPATTEPVPEPTGR